MELFCLGPGGQGALPENPRLFLNYAFLSVFCNEFKTPEIVVELTTPTNLGSTPVTRWTGAAVTYTLCRLILSIVSCAYILPLTALQLQAQKNNQNSFKHFEELKKKVKFY